MTNETIKLFVYGTLLLGEPRSHFLNDCSLIETLEVPGELYFTEMGYPVASFERNSKSFVFGELYNLPVRNLDKKISILDELEGVDDGLFRRKLLRYNGHRFYTYEVGKSLKNTLIDRQKIESGNWRLHGSTAIKDPVQFAINFENNIAKSYQGFPPDDSVGAIFLRGVTPILASAPHASAHIRMNKLKSEEKYTGALSVILHSITGSHTLYTHMASRIDPNFYEKTVFKNELEKLIKGFGIRFVLDIHGTSVKRDNDIYPGLGIENEFLKGNKLLLEKLIQSAKKTGIKLGGLNVFPASRQMTVTKFVARKLGIPAMQIEINERLRKPEYSPISFNNLVRFLVHFISSVNKHLS